MVAVAQETRTMSMKDALNEALRIAMREDPNVILLGEDIAGGANVDHLINEDAWGGPMGVTKNLVQEFGRDRVLDTQPARSTWQRIEDILFMAFPRELY